jgi:predicted signal transduction protein with EAL and GGDEF domain
VSIGIGVFPRDGTNPEMLLKSADMALFDAKAHGGSVYQFFSRHMSAPEAEAGCVRYRSHPLGADV